jgi:hypothetical protein
MNGGGAGRQSGNPADLRPSVDDRCAECGDAIGDEWVSYRQDSGGPRTLLRHFGGIIRRAVEPRSDRPAPTIRDFRYPEDMGVFFHLWCAPRVKLPEKTQEEIAKLLAQIVVADYERSIARWARVRQSAPGESDPLRCHAHVASVEGRRVFTMARAEWERFRAHEGKLVEIDLERTPTGDESESASVIACLAAECSVHTARIEVWRYNEKDQPRLNDIVRYLVLENLARRLNLPMFAQRAKTEDSPKLGKHLRENVFVVKERPDKGRWEAKAQALERLVFLSI